MEQLYKVPPSFAGFRFRNVAKDSQEQLEQWLDQQMEQEFPGAKERMAAAESGSN